MNSPNSAKSTSSCRVAGQSMAASAYARRVMLLAVDVGNTQTVYGLFDGELLGDCFRVATDARRTGDELGALVGRFLDLAGVDGISLSSTVPPLIREYEVFAERWAQAPVLVLGPGIPVRT